MLTIHDKPQIMNCLKYTYDQASGKLLVSDRDLRATPCICPPCSCWAVSSAAAISDRLCIATNGSVKVQISADDIMTCCLDCGRGCHGGWPVYAFDYFSTDGAVTGGRLLAGLLPSLRDSLVDGTGASRTTTAKPLIKEHPPEAAIQREIMKNGPVVATYTVYQDFVHYKRGIYK
ncbi:papain family cysteine protease, partial [Ostertagia ostertagi]